MAEGHCPTIECPIIEEEEECIIECSPITRVMIMSIQDRIDLFRASTTVDERRQHARDLLQVADGFADQLDGDDRDTMLCLVSAITSSIQDSSCEQGTSSPRTDQC